MCIEVNAAPGNMTSAPQRQSTRSELAPSCTSLGGRHVKQARVPMRSVPNRLQLRNVQIVDSPHTHVST
jgi:hypothetical protein